MSSRPVAPRSSSPASWPCMKRARTRRGGEIQSRLPNLQEGEPLVKTAERPEQKFTQPPTRYTEATLIRALEEKGIGRPSTYAPTITTIMNREY
ncbi:MAG: DNA topoisomerase, partial [Evtepia sp.]